MTGSFFAELRRRNVFRVAVLYGIVAWLILQVSDIAMPALRLPEWTLSFVLYLLAIGFPIALIVAWAFELTPEGLKRTREVDPDESITPVTGQKINHLIIAVLAVAVAYLLLDKFLISGTADREIPVAGEIAPAASGVALTSIAVLPFVNMSADPEQEYFADGISEELLNLLAKIEDFKVAGRTSSFAFKGKNEDLRVIADKLGVSTVLEGSVRKDGDQIRVTAQLVKADDGYHLWSETYDRKLDSIFAIQDEIASEVVSALKHTLLGEEDKAVIASAPRTQNTEAYTSYLRGKHILRVRNEENLYKALREFRHATEVDPDFAPAWAGVANTYTLLANYQFRPDTEVLPLAESAVDKSLSLDPNLGEAWAAKGLIFRQQRGTSEQAIAPLEKAVQLSPSDAEALMWLSGAYAETGQYDKAMASLREAYEIDPLFPVLLSNLAIQAGNAGDAEGAARYLSELASVAPDDLTTFRAEAFVASNFGHWDDSFKAMRKAYEAGMGDLFLLGLLADRSLDYGDPVQAAEYADAMRKIDPLSPWATTIDATILYQAGQKKEAADLIDEALLKQPDDELLAYFAAAFAIARGDRDAAKQYLDAGLKSDPEHGYWLVDNFDSQLGSAYLLEIYHDRGETDAAAKLYEIASAQTKASSPGATWNNHYSQARLEGAMGNVAEMKRHLARVVELGGHSMYFGAWDTMILKYSDDPEVAELLQRLDAKREEARRTLVAEGLIADSSGGAGG